MAHRVSIMSVRPETAEHNGKSGVAVRAVTRELDGEAFAGGIAKTVVKLDGEDDMVIFWNDEARYAGDISAEEEAEWQKHQQEVLAAAAASAKKRAAKKAG